jgi:hypothetical protein
MVSAAGAGAQGRPLRGAQALSRVRPAARVLPVALVLGWGADRLFYDQWPGLAVPLYVALLLGALALLARLEGAPLARRNLWIVPPLLFFALMIAVRANEFLTALNFMAVVLLLALVASFALAGRLHHLGVMGYPLATLQVLLEAALRPAPALWAVLREGWGWGRGLAPPGRVGGWAGWSLGRRGAPSLRLALPVLRGVVVAVPVLLLFTALLAAADSIFADYVGRFFDFWTPDSLPDVSEALWRLTFTLFVAWAVAGGLLFALQRGAAGPGVAPGARGAGEATLLAVGRPARRLGFVEGATVLALLNALFGAFVWVQFAYLFSGQAATMHFERYRDYARKGFFELLVVTVLSMGLILSLRWITSKRTVRQAYAINALCSLTIALSLVMLASALQRLVLWESVQYYINTPTRLYVRTFIAWLGVAYLWLLVTLWLRQDRFAVGGFVCALGFLVTVNLLNPDADTARYNLARPDDLATRYVSLLSDDAVPALAAGLSGPDGVQGAQREALRRHLSERLRAMERQGPGDWRSLHLARHQARQSLVALRASGQID